VQQDLAPFLADAPGRENRLACLACPKPLGDAVHEEIDDPILAEVTRRERLVLGPQPLGDLAHGRPAQQPTSGFVRERVFDVARRQSACVELDRQVLERAGPTRQVCRIPETNGSAVSRTCGAANSTTPSAVFIRPVRYPFR